MNGEVKLSPSMENILKKFDTYKYNPTSIQDAALGLLDEVMGEGINIADANSPFMFLLSVSALNTALANNENIVNLRKMYPSLAKTHEDLYLHMSDVDYIDRFAKPSETVFKVAIQLPDVREKLLYDEQEGLYKATIARNTVFSFGDLEFTLLYPIDIRRHPNDTIVVSYDPSVKSPIETLNTNIIDSYIRGDDTGVEWLLFDIPLKQLTIETKNFPLQKSTIFSKEMDFKDNFYYARVFYNNNNTKGKWVEILTTHTDQVFDPETPTATLKVLDGRLKVEIPHIYILNNQLSGNLRVDIYTTKGEITLDLSEFKVEAFGMRSNPIEKALDQNHYTNAFNRLAHYTFSSHVVSGGRKELSLEELRERVIYDSLGERKVPITNIELEHQLIREGFELVRNVDVITNRVFLAVRKLPQPVVSKLNSPANLGISTLIANHEYLSTHPNVRINDDQFTILSNNLYKDVGGKLTLLQPSDIEAITSLPKDKQVEIVNSNQYLYTPFYYVVDSRNGELESRAYNLDHPTSGMLSFLDQNQTLQMPVNTYQYEFIKNNKGYRLFIITKSSSFYKNTPDNLVNLQVAFKPKGDEKLVYLDSVLARTLENGERLYYIDFETNYEIDSDHNLTITNARLFDQTRTKVQVSLKQEIFIFYTTNSITEYFRPSKMDDLIGKQFLPSGSQAVSQESLILTFGYSLTNLWTRARNLLSGGDYERYLTDVYLVADKDEYEIDPKTGSIFSIDENGELVYNLIRKKGDPITDEEGNPIIKHAKGSVKLDALGNPIPKDPLRLDKEIDLLMVDGKNYFVDDPSSVPYRVEITSTLNNWITDTLKKFQDRLLEKSKIYFYPKTTLGKVRVMLENGNEAYIESEQSLVVDLYVNTLVFNNVTARERIEEICISILDNHISGTIINTSQIHNELKEALDGTVETIDINGLGGKENYRYLKLASEHNRLCLRKKLVLQQDNTLVVKEDVTFNFNRIGR